jgi:hypothetical protein
MPAGEGENCPGKVLLSRSGINMERQLAYANYEATCYNNADMIIYWDRQPIYSGPVAAPARAFLAAKKRGAKIAATNGSS